MEPKAKVIRQEFEQLLQQYVEKMSAQHHLPKQLVKQLLRQAPSNKKL
jgi:hypothetical protein